MELVVDDWGSNCCNREPRKWVYIEFKVWLILNSRGLHAKMQKTTNRFVFMVVGIGVWKFTSQGAGTTCSCSRLTIIPTPIKLGRVHMGIYTNIIAIWLLEWFTVLLPPIIPSSRSIITLEKNISNKNTWILLIIWQKI